MLSWTRGADTLWLAKKGAPKGLKIFATAGEMETGGGRKMRWNWRLAELRLRCPAQRGGWAC